MILLRVRETVFDPVVDFGQRQPSLHRRLGDPEIGSDIRTRQPATGGNRNSITLEPLRELFRLGNIFPERAPLDRDVNQTWGSPSLFLNRFTGYGRYP